MTIEKKVNALLTKARKIAWNKYDGMKKFRVGYKIELPSIPGVEWEVKEKHETIHAGNVTDFKGYIYKLVGTNGEGCFWASDVLLESERWIEYEPLKLYLKAS